MKTITRMSALWLLAVLASLSFVKADTYAPTRLVTFWLKDTLGNGVGNPSSMSSESSYQFFIGQSSGSGLARILRSYTLPALGTNEDIVSATLSFNVKAISGQEIGNISLYHSVDDPLASRDPNAFGDTSYTLAQADIANASEISSAFKAFTVDVADLLRADYNYSETMGLSTIVSSFRFQIDLAYGNSGPDSYGTTSSMVYEIQSFLLTMETQVIPEPSMLGVSACLMGVLTVAVSRRSRRSR